MLNHLHTTRTVAMAAAAAGTAALALASPASAATYDKWLAVNCPQPYSQRCEASGTFAVDSDGPIFVEFTGDPGGCADMALNLNVNGKHIASTQIGPGQSDGGNTVDGSPNGMYYLSLDASGVEGGCNTGAMSGWAGNLHVETT